VLALAVLVGAAAWSVRHGQIDRLWSDWPRPAHLQVQIVALGGLSLVWLLLRIGLVHIAQLRPEPDQAGNPTPPGLRTMPAWPQFPMGSPQSPLCSRENCRALLRARPSVDRVVHHLVVWGAWLLAGLWLLPSVAQELLPGLMLPAWARSVQQQACSGTAWLGVVVLGATTMLALWHRWGRFEAAAAVGVLGMFGALVAAGKYAVLAVASTERWMLAGGLLGVCALLWWQRPLAGALRRLGAQIEPDPLAPRVFWRTAFCCLALPVLVLTLVGSLLAVFLQQQGMSFGGPAPGTLFARMGLAVSYEIPVLLILAAMLGVAWQRGSSGLVFGAGLVLQLAVGCAYILLCFDAGRAFSVATPAVLLQLWSITAAVWAGVWLAGRRFVSVWHKGRATHFRPPQTEHEHTADPASPGAGRRDRLLGAQIWLGAGGMGALLVPAVLQLVLRPDHQGVWLTTAGRWPSWLALVLLVAVGIWHGRVLGRHLSPRFVGLAGMAAVALAACTLPALPARWHLEVQWGYRALMLGWAAFAWFIVLGMWWAATVRTAGSSSRAFPPWSWD